jgi:CRISPR-associated endonuclease Cas2
MKKRTKRNIQDDEDLTTVGKVLTTLLIGVDMLPRPFESKTRYVKRLFSGRMDYKMYYKVLTRLQERGWVKVFGKKKKKDLFPELTKQGVLEALFVKAQMPGFRAKDGKWRMVLFDIPEDARSQRNRLRRLLYKNCFRSVQKSVFISPYELNADAIQYLRLSGLDKYIRIFRIDKADKEDELKKMFSDLKDNAISPFGDDRPQMGR